MSWLKRVLGVFQNDGAEDSKRKFEEDYYKETHRNCPEAAYCQKIEESLADARDDIAKHNTGQEQECCLVLQGKKRRRCCEGNRQSTN